MSRDDRLSSDGCLFEDGWLSRDGWLSSDGRHTSYGCRLGSVQETRFKDRHCAVCKWRGLMQVLLIKYPFGQPVECRSF